MPLYDFVRLDDPEVKDSFYFTMKECPRVSETFKDEKGVVWKRVFTLPFATIDGKIDPNNPNSFVEKTAKMKGTVGNLFDASKELSDKRAKEHGGQDPVQKKFFQDYKAKRHGIEHLAEKKSKKIDKKDFTISYD